MLIQLPKDKVERSVFIIFFCAILFLLPVYYICYRAEAFGLYHDDGVYLVNAKSLAEHGTYSTESLPNPIPQTKYPILYPLILALLLKINPNIPANLWLLKLSSLIFAIAWFYLIYRLISHRYSRVLACIALAFIMASPWILYMSASLLPDLLFSTLCLGCAMVLDKSRQHMQRYREVLIAALLAGAAFLVNAKGITIIIAAILFLLIQRKWKQLILFGFVVAITCLPWLVWQSIIPAPSDPILRYYSKLSYPAGHILGNYSFGQAVHVFAKNVRSIGLEFIDLTGIHLPGTSLTHIFLLGLAFLSVAGFWHSIRNQITAADLWFVFHVGMLLLWVWPPGRYLIPLLPIFLCYAGISVSNLASHCSQVLKPRLVTIGVTLCLLVLAYTTTYQSAAFARDNSSVAITSGRDPEDWQAIKTLCAWIGANTKPDAIITTNLDPLVYLLTGRKSIRAFKGDPYLLIYSSDENRRPLGDVVEFRNHLMRYKITHLMVTPMSFYPESPHFIALLSRFTHRYPGVMKPVFMTKDSSSQIWEVDHEKLASLEK
jgi:4-amino-4-deoxy-L-arabinose transferase-like glycosyltransferase